MSPATSLVWFLTWPYNRPIRTLVVWAVAVGTLQPIMKEECSFCGSYSTVYEHTKKVCRIYTEVCPSISSSLNLVGFVLLRQWTSESSSLTPTLTTSSASRSATPPPVSFDPTKGSGQRLWGSSSSSPHMSSFAPEAGPTARKCFFTGSMLNYSGATAGLLSLMF